MFDPKSIIDMLTRGAGQAQQPQGGGGLGDILGQLSKSLGQQGGAPQSQGGGMGGLGDILKNMVPSEPQGRQPQMHPGSAQGGQGGVSAASKTF
ncbi:MAG: hypothetical protein ACKVP7_23835 [Hyphomicrobiaceae bacterium]